MTGPFSGVFVVVALSAVLPEFRQPVIRIEVISRTYSVFAGLLMVLGLRC
jgi:hypothetical protein